ncbi:unnamed protein product, partial [Discosporangium mesarthrocarpum]
SILEPPQLTTVPWSSEEGLSLTDYRSGRVRVTTPDHSLAITLMCVPLPDGVAKALEWSPEE